MLVFFYSYQSIRCFQTKQDSTNTAQGKREATYQALVASAEEFFKCIVHQIKDIDCKTAKQPHPLIILEFKQV